MQTISHCFPIERMEMAVEKFGPLTTEQLSDKLRIAEDEVEAQLRWCSGKLRLQINGQWTFNKNTSEIKTK